MLLQARSTLRLLVGLMIGAYVSLLVLVPAWLGAEAGMAEDRARAAVHTGAVDSSGSTGLGYLVLLAVLAAAGLTLAAGVQESRVDQLRRRSSSSIRRAPSP